MNIRDMQNEGAQVAHVMQSGLQCNGASFSIISAKYAQKRNIICGGSRLRMHHHKLYYCVLD